MERVHTVRALPRALRLPAVLASLLLVLGVGVAAGDEDDEREVQVDVSSSKAVVKSESKAPDRKDELVLEFDNGEHLFLLKYESEDGDEELEAEVKVELEGLLEWRDLNGNGRLDPDAGEVVQRVSLDDLDPSSVTFDPVEVEGVQGVKVVGASSAPDKHGDLALTLTLHAFGQFLEVGGTSLEPTSMKFDIHIEGFPYQEEDSALALSATVEMKAEAEAEGVEEDGGEAIAARIGKYVSFFSWGAGVSVDGQPGTVGQTVVKREEKSELEGDGQESKLKSELYLLYPRGESILHDPKLGVRTASGGGAACSLP